MVGGIGPILGVIDKAMFDWVDPAIADVVSQVLFVPDMVFPKPALPEAGVAFLHFRGAA